MLRKIVMLSVSEASRRRVVVWRGQVTNVQIVMLSVSEASRPRLSETSHGMYTQLSEWAKDSVGATFMVARGWGCGRFSDEPASSDNPPRATIKIADFSG